MRTFSQEESTAKNSTVNGDTKISSHQTVHEVDGMDSSIISATAMKNTSEMIIKVTTIKE